MYECVQKHPKHCHMLIIKTLMRVVQHHINSACKSVFVCTAHTVHVVLLLRYAFRPFSLSFFLSLRYVWRMGWILILLMVITSVNCLDL